MTPSGEDTVGNTTSAERHGVAHALFIGLTLIVGIGLVDWWTGIYLAFSPFYLVPIAMAGWYCPPRVTFTLVGASTIAWYAAEYGWEYSFPGWVSLWNGATRAVIFGVAASLIVRLRRQSIHLEAVNRRLNEQLQRERELSRTDPLTALANRRAFHDALVLAVARARATRGPVSLAILDLDNFKRVNDAYGHPAGDSLLQCVAAGLVSTVRKRDIVSRLGGDEFGVVFDDAGSDNLVGIADRLVAVVERAACSWPTAGVGVSVGLVTFTSPPEIDAIIRAADQVMYRSKREGKGRVTVSNI